MVHTTVEMVAMLASVAAGHAVPMVWVQKWITVSVAKISLGRDLLSDGAT
jgi:hypothetical protein